VFEADKMSFFDFTASHLRAFHWQKVAGWFRQKTNCLSKHFVFWAGQITSHNDSQCVKPDCTWLFWWWRKMVTAPVDDAVTILSWSKNYKRRTTTMFITEAKEPCWLVSFLQTVIWSLLHTDLIAETYSVHVYANIPFTDFSKFRNKLPDSSPIATEENT